MNKKIFLCLVLAVALCFGAVLSANVGEANAIDVSVRKLFTTLSGSATEIVYDDEETDRGVVITMPGSSLNSAISYVQYVSMEEFKFDFYANKVFDKLSFAFTDINDSSNVAYLFIEKIDDTFKAYTKKGNYDNLRTDITSTILPVGEGTADTDLYSFSIEFTPYDVEAQVLQSFKVNGLEVDGAFNFDYNVVNFDLNLKKSKVGDDDVVMIVRSMTNKKGTQMFTKAAEEVAPLIWQDAKSVMPEGVVGEDGRIVYTYNDLVGKVSASYTFPVYAISMIGSTSMVKTEVYVEDAEEEGGWKLLSESLRTNYTLSSEEVQYKIIIKVVDGDSVIEEHILMVKSIEDTVAPLFNEPIFEVRFNSDMPDGVIYSNDDVSLPSFKEDGVFINNLFIFPEEDRGIDTEDNVSIRLGYKKPGSTSDWIWTTSYSLKFDTEGTWSFKYKVIDASGNENESKTEFTREVVDNTPPTITATENLEAYLDTIYTISIPGVTDVGSGVDSSKTVIRLFKGIRGSDNVEEIELSVNYKFIPDVLTGEDEDYTYFVEYIAYDYNGNESDKVYSYISVSEPKVEEAEGPDWLVIGLIALSVVIVVVILVMIFYKPKETEVQGSKKYISKK